jgi:hypothetical protein
VSGKRKSIESVVDSPKSGKATSMSTGGRKSDAGDTGSAKKPKRKRKFLEKLDAVDEAESDVEYLKLGLVRDSAFTNEDAHHLLVISSAKSSVEELARTKNRPQWTKEADTWCWSVLKQGRRRNQPLFEGKKRAGIFADLGFIYLPCGLRPSVVVDSVPDWNLWDDTITSSFFNFMKTYLSDDGYLAVLHSGELTIRER